MKVGDKVIFVTYADKATITGVLDGGLYVVKYDGKEYIADKGELARLTDETPPEPYILIPVGEYDGSDLYDYEVIDAPYCHGQFGTLIDDYGIVWSVLPNPEAECIIISE